MIVLTLTAAPLNAAAAETPEMLVPMGNVVGITAAMDGVMVIETMDDSAAEEAGIKAGDIITDIDEKEIKCGGDVSESLDGCSGEVVVKVSRNGKSMEIPVEPEDGQLGVWLRDGVTGIGTVTYYDPDTGSFGALGHAINDCDTGVQLPLRDGKITEASLTEIIAGQPGTPGQLQGIVNYENEYGSISDNTCHGIFGTITEGSLTEDRQAYPVADENEVRTGDAVILSDALDGELREYSVEVSRIFTGIITGGKDMMITIKDDRLLDSTGGIVQGMSGSPIIQDGKFIGAVTHVLVNEPTKGYGIFIENMLDAAA